MAIMELGTELTEEELEKVDGGSYLRNETYYKCPKCGLIKKAWTDNRNGKIVCQKCGSRVSNEEYRQGLC